MRRAVRGGLWAATIVASSVRLAGQSPPDAVEAEVAGRRALLEVARHHAFPAIDASDLTQLWGGVTRRGVFLRAHVLGDELAFEAGSPFFRHGDRTYQLVNPPYEWGGAFWLPAEFVTGWLAEHGSPVAVAPESLPAGDEALPDRVDPAKPWHVVIDPGHGGRDPGTSGRQSNEKDVVLGIGRRLYEELQRRDLIEPYLTRDTDVYVKHDLRSQFAVDQGGDLFVSIHANWASDARATGFETIFLGPARSEEAREVALRENRGPSVEDAVGSPADIQFILTGLDRTEKPRPIAALRGLRPERSARCQRWKRYGPRRQTGPVVGAAGSAGAYAFGHRRGGIPLQPKRGAVSERRPGAAGVGSGDRGRDRGVSARRAPSIRHR